MTLDDFSPSISVLLPVFNGECWLRDCIESVLSQTFSDFELLIIDDGSTDSSLKIIHYYESSDPRVRCLGQENHGLECLWENMLFKSPAEKILVGWRLVERQREMDTRCA